MLALACTREPPTPPAPPPLALHETPAASVDELCEPQVRSWAVLAEGHVVARSRGACLGRIEAPEIGPLWQFVAQLQHEGATQVAWELYAWLDVDGRLRHAEFRTPEVITRFAWQGEQLIVHRLGDMLVLDDAAALWVTPEHGVYLRELMLRLAVGRDGAELIQRGFVPDRDAITQLALTLERLDDDHAQARGEQSVLGLDGASVGLAGLRVSTVLAGDAPIYRPFDGDALAPPLPARPSPHYSLPESLERLPIEIPGGEDQPQLAAELVVPAGSSAAAKPLRRPAVLFIGGAGPQDRHGFVPDSSIDIGSHELHDALALAGFAVLRVDDRGVGHSTIGDEPTPGFRSLVDDHRRALAALAGHAHVDPSKLIVIGHGEGALLASILAGEGVRASGRKRAIAGVVLLAGPGRNLRELVYDEIRASLAGHRDGEIRTAVDRARRVHDAALAGQELPASSEAARLWMIEAFAEDPLARLAKVRAPIFALQGGKDFQVSPERDFEPIRALVERRGGQHDRTLLLPELDHLFKHEPGMSTPGHYADLRRRVDAEVIAAIVEWAAAIAGP